MNNAFQMKRRAFLRTTLSAATLAAFGRSAARVAFAAAPVGANYSANYRNLLVLIELKGFHARPLAVAGQSATSALR